MGLGAVWNTLRAQACTFQQVWFNFRQLVQAVGEKQSLRGTERIGRRYGQDENTRRVNMSDVACGKTPCIQEAN